MDNPGPVASELLRRYGPLLNTEQLATVLGYRTAGALQKAIRRGKLPIPVRRLPGRRGWYASTAQAGAWIDQAFSIDTQGGPR